MVRRARGAVRARNVVRLTAYADDRRRRDPRAIYDVFGPQIWDASTVATQDALGTRCAATGGQRPSLTSKTRATSDLSTSPGRSTSTNGAQVNHVQHPLTESMPYTHPVAGVQR